MSGSIKFLCQECGKKLKATSEQVGQKVKCPGCSTVLSVPATGNGDPSSAAAPPLPPSIVPSEVSGDQQRREDSCTRDAKQWKVFAFPTSYILDGKGRIKLGGYGAIDWEEAPVVSQIEQLLVCEEKGCPE